MFPRCHPRSEISHSSSQGEIVQDAAERCGLLAQVDHDVLEVGVGLE